MSPRKINQLKVGSILSYMQMGINIAIQLLYTPVMIRLLGKSEYGVYNTVASTISMLSMLTLGFNAGYIRFYSIYKKKEDSEAIAKLNGLFIIVFTIVAVVALVCGLYLSLNLNLVFADGLTRQEYETARMLTLITTISLALSFPMSVFQQIVSAHERFVVLKLIGMLKTVLGPLVTLPLLLAGFRSVAMVTVTTAVAFIADCAYLYYIIAVMQERFIFRDFEKGLFRRILVFTVFIALNTFVNEINWNIDKVLLGRFKGTSEVAVYSVAYTLYQCYMLLSTSVSGVFTPRAHRIVNDTNNNINMRREQLTILFTKVGRIQFLVLGLIATGLIFFGEYFIVNIWAGKGYDDSYIVALMLIIPASIALIQNMGIEIQRAENLHKFRGVAYTIMAVVNLLMSIMLCQHFGAVGSAIGTAVSLLLANGVIMNVYYHRKCSIDIIYFWKNIARMSVGLIIPICFGVILCYTNTIDSSVEFLLFVIAYSLVYSISMWIIGLNEYERNLVLVPISRILERKNA